MSPWHIICHKSTKYFIPLRRFLRSNIIAVFMKIVFATGNVGKLREASEILGEGFELVSLADVGIFEDIPETGKTLRANSLQKAQ